MAAFRAAHTELAQPKIPGRTWQKLVAFAGRTGVSPRAAPEGLVEFVLAEPARRRPRSGPSGYESSPEAKGVVGERAKP